MIKKISGYIELFLKGAIDGVLFEKMYSECYDFEELELTQDLEYFKGICNVPLSQILSAILLIIQFEDSKYKAIHY